MYIPKNRIKTNLYTRGNEFQLKSTGEIYTGYYHQLYTGRYFTGKTPNDRPIRELIKESRGTDKIWEATANDPADGQGFQQYASNYDGVFENQNPNAMQDTDTYNFNKKVDESKIKMLPQQYYPRPTEDDYKLGVFTRYFVIKANEIRYIEINEDTYKKLSKQDPKWSYELYLPFKLQWTLTGDKIQTYNTNRNIVKLTERRLKKPGLSLFLRDNYLQFYQD